jgi:hypothetical protein
MVGDNHQWTVRRHATETVDRGVHIQSVQRTSAERDRRIAGRGPGVEPAHRRQSNGACQKRCRDSVHVTLAVRLV